MASTVAPRKTLGYAAARARVLEAAGLLPPETVALDAALGRALREDVVAPHDLPPFRNSAMDGFAVRSADLAVASASQPVRLEVVGTLAAGSAPSRALGRGETVKIMTGAMLPEGADSIVPVEEITSDGSFARPAAPGAHVREAGRDLARGALAMSAGRALSPHDLALLGSLGIPRVAVGRRPRVAVLSTGNELTDIDAPVAPGRIRDSNSLLLSLLLEEAGIERSGGRRLPDDAAIVAQAIGAALEQADVVITIGGVSMGDFDPVRDGIVSFPWVELWRVAMRPGQPQAFGAADGRLFFGLPGNPASVACVFEALVRPALRWMQGHHELDRPRLLVHAAERFESRAGRTDFVRVRLAAREGAWWAMPAGDPISGHIAPQSRADALLVIPEPVAALDRGAAATALVLRWPAQDG